MRMSLSRMSGRCCATEASAASPLFAKVAPNPARVKTSQSSSHVTESSSTVRICGILRGICIHLVCFYYGQHHSKLSALHDFNRSNFASMFDDDLTRDGETQTAAGLLSGPHRLEQVIPGIVADARA